LSDLLNTVVAVDDIADNQLNFKHLFKGLNYKRLEVEIGFCSAFFLSENANNNSNAAFFGIEIKKKYFDKGNSNLKRLLKQQNVKTVNFEAMAVVSQLIPDDSIDAFHIYFPDPWPKKKHHKNRILKSENFETFAKKMKKGGKLFAATDHPDYGSFIKKEILKVKEIFNVLPYTHEDRSIKTKWEKKQIAAGWDINYFLLEKK